MAPRRVSTSTVIVRSSHPFERRRLIDWDTRRTVLVFVRRVRVVYRRALGRKLVGSLFSSVIVAIVSLGR